MDETIADLKKRFNDLVKQGLGCIWFGCVTLPTIIILALAGLTVLRGIYLTNVYGSPWMAIENMMNFYPFNVKLTFLANFLYQMYQSWITPN